MTSYDDSLDHERRSEREEREREEQAWCDACGETVDAVYVCTAGLCCTDCMALVEVT